MSEVKYDRHYREDPRACGAPFKELQAFAEALPPEPLDVLDLGCGQGRDALLFARRGHRVWGVDISRVGVQQLNAAASQEGLRAQAVVADVVEYTPERSFDVIILDRVLHMLHDELARRRVLERAAAALRPGGHLLIADEPKHRAFILAFLQGLPGWTLVKSTRNRWFARRGRAEGWEPVPHCGPRRA
ncbi:MAG: class I SAM-dependent methyltransferase [Alphaproteobacteria bacterium]|nr:class I SAM-dependent methyltransferase [Alphaproteobacteria bacterium]